MYKTEEASAMLKLVHPNIIRLYGTKAHEDKFNLIMENARGGDLDRYIDSSDSSCNEMEAFKMFS